MSCGATMSTLIWIATHFINPPFPPSTYPISIHPIPSRCTREGSVNRWNEWMAYIQPYASRLPYHVSIGACAADLLTMQDGSRISGNLSRHEIHQVLIIVRPTHIVALHQAGNHEYDYTSNQRPDGRDPSGATHMFSPSW